MVYPTWAVNTMNFPTGLVVDIVKISAIPLITFAAWCIRTTPRFRKYVCKKSYLRAAHDTSRWASQRLTLHNVYQIITTIILRSGYSTRIEKTPVDFHGDMIAFYDQLAVLVLPMSSADAKELTCQFFRDLYHELSNAENKVRVPIKPPKDYSFYEDLFLTELDGVTIVDVLNNPSDSIRSARTKYVNFPQ